MKKLLSICLKGFLVLIALMFLMQGVARADLYGVTYGDPNSGALLVDEDVEINACYLSRLYRIDPNTGIQTDIGDIRYESSSDTTIGYWGVSGIDFDPLTGTLYAIGFRCSDMVGDTPYLLTLDPCTGMVLNEDEIDMSELEGTSQQFTDISFLTDGTLYAYYIFYTQTAGISYEGAVATIDTDDGDAEAVGEGTGQMDYIGNGISFLLQDPNMLYQAESKDGTTFEGNLNELNIDDDGEIDDTESLNFNNPIATDDFPAIFAMDNHPVTDTLYASVVLTTYTDTSAGANWICTNYLVTVDEGNGDVKVIGCLSGPYTDYELDFEPYEIRALAFAPLPVADAGADITVEQTSREGAVVCLDGSGSYDDIDCCGDPLLFIWDWTQDTVERLLYGKTPCVVLPLGTHEIDLTVDNCNGTDYDTVQVTVQDTTPPMITCLPDIEVEQESHAGTLVDPNPPHVYDICDPNVTVTGIADPNHPLPYVFPLGRHTVTWTATDDAGITAVCTQNVTVVDTKPPSINSVTATPDTLFPSMCGLLHEITVQVDANDVCDPAPTCKIISVSSNQEGSRWFKEPDWFITGPHTVLLRAKKDMFSRENRIYTITVKCTDASGNGSMASTTVEVGYGLNNDGFLPSFPRRDDTDRRFFFRRSRR